jgi:hypothetical protein
LFDFDFLLNVKAQEIEQGPSWTDFDERSMIRPGLPKDSVIKILGTPFLPVSGAIENGRVVEVLIYKLRPKIYPVVIASTFGKVSAKPSKTIMSSPIKFWGEYYDSKLTFINDTLKTWEVPLYSGSQK